MFTELYNSVDTINMSIDEILEEVKKPELDPAEYDELYPDYVKEKPHKEVAEIVKETRRDVPISDDVKVDIYNRLIGIQNLANEWKQGKYAKIIMLVEEVIDMLGMKKEDEKKDG